MGRAILLPSLQGHEACNRVNFTLLYFTLLYFTLLYFTLRILHVYNVMYGVRYYLWFHITAVGLGTYYPWIRGQYCNCLLYMFSRPNKRKEAGTLFFVGK
jgi:hypothetical protein